MRERLAETARLEKVSQRLALRVRRIEQCRRFPIEAHDLPEQEEVRRLDQVLPLREEPVGAPAAVLEAGPPARHGKRHVRVPRGHAELPEQPHQVRIGAVVVHQEAGIERDGAVRGGNQDRIGVTAQTRLLFEELHPVSPAQEIGSGQAGDAGADDRDVFHAALRSSSTVHVMSSSLSMTNA